VQCCERDEIDSVSCPMAESGIRDAKPQGPTTGKLVTSKYVLLFANKV
jgi:hypothetical protein